jgi:hypothetical protein
MISFKQELSDSFKEYKMTIKEPSLEEKESQDERELLLSIRKMNKEYKEIQNQENPYNYKTFHTNSNSYESLNQISPNKFKDSTSLSTLPNSGVSFFSDQENFLNQNLISFSDIIKLIVIGDRMVGKTLFVDKLVSNSQDVSKYCPTQR